jgi:hypothetical protein
MAVLLAAAPVAHAQTEGQVEATSETQSALGEARLRYGATSRTGSDDAANLTYSGLTPDDLALAVDYFPAIIGGDLKLQAEGFSLNSSGTKVTSGRLVRLEVGPAVRGSFGPFRIDGLVNYQLAQLPSFGPPGSPAFATATRHSLLLASRAHLDLPFGAMVEASGGVPIALSTKDQTGGSASSSGFAVGGSIGYRVAQTERLAYVALLDYQYVHDSLTDSAAAGGAVLAQSLNRFGIAFEVQYLEPPSGPPPLRTGGVTVTVLDETGKPMENAGVEIQAGAQRWTLTTASDGKAIQRELPPGPLLAKASSGGFLPGEGNGQIRAGEDAAVELRLKKEPPKTGGLRVSFVDKQTQAPLPGAKAVVREVEYIADETGALSLIDLPPGPVEIRAEAPGYKPGQEVAQVVAGQKSPVVVALVKAEKKQPAVVTGLIRNRQTGTPIPATLEIPEAKVKIHADAKGAFNVPLPAGGTYRVIISAPGFLTQTKSVTVKEGDEVIFNVDLHSGGR